jgi:hypothetical protein
MNDKFETIFDDTEPPRGEQGVTLFAKGKTMRCAICGRFINIHSAAVDIRYRKKTQTRSWVHIVCLEREQKSS